MGRIKTMLIKRTSNDIVNKFGKELKTDFEQNKQIIAKYAQVPSKKIRNTIAGYVTRLVRSRNG